MADAGPPSHALRPMLRRRLLLATELPRLRRVAATAGCAAGAGLAAGLQYEGKIHRLLGPKNWADFSRPLIGISSQTAREDNPVNFRSRARW